MFFGTSILEGFWEGLGKHFGSILESQIIDFRIFFDIFSMQNFECNLEGQKIETNSGKTRAVIVFGADAAVSAALGGRIIGWGEACLSLKFQALPSDRPLWLGFLG